MFKFSGDLVLSKSWLNRALIIQNYQPSIQFASESDSEDVLVLKKSLTSIGKASEFYLGQGGTSFRFFCFLISRHPGTWIVKAHTRLLERPQAGLKDLLGQLGVEIDFKKDEVVIRSAGWNVPTEIKCSAKDSSQFISGLLLNSWNLETDLNIKIQGQIVSEDYFKMTVAMLQQFGMKIEEGFGQINILKKQIPLTQSAQSEVDVSSAFSLAAAGVIAGDVEITNWKSNSLQPDAVFLKLFDQMGIRYMQNETSLRIRQQSKWKALHTNLNHFPDLFPVLSILCALAEGRSDLHGAEQLQHKESNRLQKTKELLDLVGFRSELKKDGLVIEGKSSQQDKLKHVQFNPDHDHRMAMAAGLLKLAGYNIDIQNPEVVNKSYASFWKDIRINP